jgi:hypothetical protein
MAAAMLALLAGGAAAQDRDVDLSKYVGKYPDRQFLALPAVHDPLAKLLGQGVGPFLARFQVLSPMEMDGRDLVASGCVQHNCGPEQSAFTIDLDTGEVAAASVTQDKYVDIYSSHTHYDDLPPGIRHWITARTSQTAPFKKMQFRYFK